MLGIRRSQGGCRQVGAVSNQHSALSFSPDAVWMKTRNLETRRKRVNGGIKEKKPNASATSVPLCFKGFHYIRESIAELSADC